MHTPKKYRKENVKLSGDVPSMLKRARTVLSHRQYRELCISVDNAEDYTTKKGLILACLQAKENKF